MMELKSAMDHNSAFDGSMADILEGGFDKWSRTHSESVLEDSSDCSHASSMGFPQDSQGEDASYFGFSTKRMFSEGRLVVKNTFLELAMPKSGAEPEVEAKSRACPECEIWRTVSDTLIDYGNDSEASTSCDEASDIVSRAGSCRSSLSSIGCAGWQSRRSSLSSVGFEADQEFGGDADDVDLMRMRTCSDIHEASLQVDSMLSQPSPRIIIALSSIRLEADEEAAEDADNDVFRSISFASTAYGSDTFEPPPLAGQMSLQPQPENISYGSSITPGDTSNGTSHAQQCTFASQLDEQAMMLRAAAFQLEYAAHFEQVAQLWREQAISVHAGIAANAGQCAGGGCEFPTKPTCAPEATQAVSEENHTTVMLRNFPAGYTCEALMELLDSQGFKGSYDFVYLPVDFSRLTLFGYGFVNMVSHEEALRIWEHFDGFGNWPAHPDIKETDEAPHICEVAWGSAIQGRTAHIDRYRNSPVMHKDIPDRFKPVLLSEGVKIKFPPPTKRIRPPRLKHRIPGDQVPQALE